jgi:hypothetical protein
MSGSTAALYFLPTHRVALPTYNERWGASDLQQSVARLRPRVVMMESEERYTLVMQLIADQAPALFAVDGRVYEGRIESCLRGQLTAVTRAYGTRDEYRRCSWLLHEIDIAPVEAEAPADDEDLLIEQARAMSAQAKEYDELSLAERLVADRIPRGAP